MHYQTNISESYHRNPGMPWIDSSAKTWYWKTRDAAPTKTLGKKSVERHTFGFKAPISDPRALRLGLDYCRLDLLPWLFATTSSLGPLPLDQWGYLLRLFQGDFHSRQGIKQTADSPVPMMACLFTLCHAPNVTHILCEQVAHKMQCGR